MTATVSSMLQRLPPFRGIEQVIAEDQTTRDIVKEVLAAHRVYAPDYDKIVSQWMGGNFADVPKDLYKFCKKNLRYREEDNEQTTRSPAGILALKWVDCKHYAGFIAGVLDAINRTGLYEYNWVYRFASYDWLSYSPAHVFVVIKDDQGGETWIDPVPEVPGYNARTPKPVYHWDNAGTMLKRLSGIGMKGFTSTHTVSRKSIQNASIRGVSGKHLTGPYGGYGSRLGSTTAAETALLDKLKAVENGLITSVSQLQNKGVVSAGTDEILKAAGQSVPGASAALAIAQGIKTGLASTFGAGSVLTRVADAGLGGNVFSAIPNIIKAVLGGRTYNYDNYAGASDVFFYVKGIDKGATTNIADADVFPMLTWCIIKTGVFVSGRVHMEALRKSADDYLALYSVNNYTTQDRVRVQYASTVVKQYMPVNGVAMSWANAVGVYDNLVTAAIFNARKNDTAAQMDTSGTVSTPAVAVSTVTDFVSSNPLTSLLIAGLAVWGGYEIFKD